MYAVITGAASRLVMPIMPTLIVCCEYHDTAVTNETQMNPSRATANKDLDFNFNFGISSCGGIITTGLASGFSTILMVETGDVYIPPSILSRHLKIRDGGKTLYPTAQAAGVPLTRGNEELAQWLESLCFLRGSEDVDSILSALKDEHSSRLHNLSARKIGRHGEVLKGHRESKVADVRRPQQFRICSPADASAAIRDLAQDVEVLSPESMEKRRNSAREIKKLDSDRGSTLSLSPDELGYSLGAWDGGETSINGLTPVTIKDSRDFLPSSPGSIGESTRRRQSWGGISLMHGMNKFRSMARELREEISDFVEKK